MRRRLAGGWPRNRAEIVRGALIVVAAGAAVFVGGGVWAADGAVTIISPKPNATVAGDVTVTWSQQKAGKADHVHVFVDRGGMKPVRTGTSIVLRGLAKGTHEITVQAYSVEHEPLDAKASVTVTVE